MEMPISSSAARTFPAAVEAVSVVPSKFTVMVIGSRVASSVAASRQAPTNRTIKMALRTRHHLVNRPNIPGTGTAVDTLSLSEPGLPIKQLSLRVLLSAKVLVLLGIRPSRLDLPDRYL